MDKEKTRYYELKIAFHCASMNYYQCVYDNSLFEAQRYLHDSVQIHKEINRLQKESLG